LKFGVITLVGNTNNIGVFREMAETVHYGLLSLGHDSVLTRQWLQDRRLILFGMTSIPLLGVVPPAGTILYNLEQVFPGSPFFTPTTVPILRQYPVLDYSRQNIGRLAKMGVQARWLPIGYVPELTRISPASTQDIDVLFYGSLSARRKAVLEEIRGRGLRVETVPVGTYGTMRDAIISRSKVVINVHSDPGMDVFESVRVSYLLANKKAVVSERGDGHEDFADAVLFADYGELADRCAALVHDDDARADLSQRGFKVMAARSEGDYLRAALAGFL
jgi:hypothetical protein